MFLLHPAILAVVPVLYLYSSNWGQVPFSEALAPMAISLCVAMALVVALRPVLKDWRASALLVSTMLILFFTYGRLVNSLGGSRAARLVLALLYLAVLALAVWLTAKYRGALEKPTVIMNVVAGALLVMTVAGMVTNGLRREPLATTWKGEVARLAASSRGEKPPAERLPDIYYVILDGYGSENVLSRYYDFDNGAFVRALEERGFHVAKESRSNYMQTRLSLASSLNLEYINFLSREVGENSRRAGAPNMMIEDNGLAEFLKSRGYGFAFFGTNWSGTKSNRNADVSVADGGWLDSEFTTALIETTALRRIIGERGLYTREGVLRAFSLIPRIRERMKGPAFVFAHIVPPHRPFLFAADGGPTKGGPDSWREYDKYLGQVAFVNGKALEMVDEIVANSERPPVIVIQADHGPMPAGDPEGIADPDFAAADRRTGILNAYYLPPGEWAGLSQDITPVNSFRVILNELFGTGLELLENRTYASSYAKPYRFKDVTELLQHGNTRGRRSLSTPFSTYQVPGTADQSRSGK